MEFKSIQKFVRISPRKLRLVADLIRDLSPIDAVETLPHVQKRAALPLMKVIKTSIANAKQKGISEDTLVFKEIQINEGPRLKRGRPVSRGMWHPYQRKMSHVRIVLMTDQIKKNKKPKRQVQSKLKSKSAGDKKKDIKRSPALSKSTQKKADKKVKSKSKKVLKKGGKTEK
jgi:large subunit ribosomal protein L22